MARGQRNNRNADAEVNQPRGNAGQPQVLRGLLTQVTHLAQIVQDIRREPRQQRNQNAEANRTDTWLQEVSKMHPPKFDGTGDDAALEHWIIEMEKVFEGLNCPAERRVQIAQFYLEKDATEWWRARRPADYDVDWNEFKEIIEAEYCPKPIREARIREFFTAQPKEEPIRQTIKTFNQQLHYVQDQVRTEVDKIRYFDLRMTDEIRKYMSGFDCTTLRQYQDKVLAYEMVHSSSMTAGPSSKKQKTDGGVSKSKGNGSQKHQHTSHSSKRPPTPLSKGSQRTGGVKRCYNCSEVGHLSAACPLPPVKCFECGRTGH